MEDWAVYTEGKGTPPVRTRRLLGTLVNKRMHVAAGITAAGRTDIGRVRKQNQDAFGMDEGARLYAVCDGMGGAAGGEVASRVAVDTFVAAFRHELAAIPAGSPDAGKNALYYATLSANRAVYARGSAEPRLQGMGCTLVAAHIAGERLVLVNVGDSRAYLVRNGEIAQLTQDHSYLDEQVRLGLMTQEMADASGWQSVITRAVGIEHEVQPDLFGVDLEDGDFVLLASDGLTRHVEDKDIAAIVTGEGDLDDRVRTLIERACANGGSDNITCVLLHVQI